MIQVDRNKNKINQAIHTDSLREVCPCEGMFLYLRIIKRCPSEKQTAETLHFTGNLVSYCHAALRFVPHIEALGKLLVERMRSYELYIALHLRYEKDMLAFSGCTHELSSDEANALTKIRLVNLEDREDKFMLKANNEGQTFLYGLGGDGWRSCIRALEKCCGIPCSGEAVISGISNGCHELAVENKSRLQNKLFIYLVQVLYLLSAGHCKLLLHALKHLAVIGIMGIIFFIIDDCREENLLPEEEEDCCQEGERKTINAELWHACAGPLVTLPPVGSLVVYFPQGHSEQLPCRRMLMLTFQTIQTIPQS